MNEKRRRDLARRLALDPTAPVEKILRDHLAALRTDDPRGTLALEWYYREDPPVTLARIGTRLGISLERARQIKNHALQMLASYHQVAARSAFRARLTWLEARMTGWARKSGFLTEDETFRLALVIETPEKTEETELPREIVSADVAHMRAKDFFTRENLRVVGYDSENLHTRLLHIFKSEGIRTVGDIFGKTELELLRVPNMGRMSLDVIKKILALHDLEIPKR